MATRGVDFNATQKRPGPRVRAAVSGSHGDFVSRWEHSISARDCGAERTTVDVCPSPSDYTLEVGDFYCVQYASMRTLFVKEIS